MSEKEKRLAEIREQSKIPRKVWKLHRMCRKYKDTPQARFSFSIEDVTAVFEHFDAGDLTSKLGAMERDLAEAREIIEDLIEHLAPGCPKLEKALALLNKEQADEPL